MKRDSPGTSWDKLRCSFFPGQGQEQNHYLIGKTKVKNIKKLSKKFFFSKIVFFFSFLSCVPARYGTEQAVKILTRPVLGHTTVNNLPNEFALVRLGKKLEFCYTLAVSSYKTLVCS